LNFSVISYFENLEKIQTGPINAYQKIILPLETYKDLS